MVFGTTIVCSILWSPLCDIKSLPPVLKPTHDVWEECHYTPGARSAMVAMYLLGGTNDVIIEQSEATCSCDCLLGHRANTYLKAPRCRTQRHEASSRDPG